MILYLDTSAIVPLLISEPSSERCGRLWDVSRLRFTARITYVEAAAALAAAERSRRIDSDVHAQALAVLDVLWSQVQIVELDDSLMKDAAAIAHEAGLRGYDAVHCASAMRLARLDPVGVSGDRALLEAWRNHGVDVADANSQA
ncbi:PIN domain-containing protein [Microbacterium bovistercoris]|uniref:Ribonuclease VapC n=1 Tax=Microbacterium bovistercoris TaxID=2293570 RepID=A0A371NTE1_9MICO|nr:type II toxin-antitoxin system VapC family toxin [Microbacterium bovistercoris]REJ05516.1 PIN domain-containing protein [Microbacterium bovistercoris]